METTLRSRGHRRESLDGGGSDDVWGVRGIMDKDILPAEPAERRRRSRLCALRALDRLGLLGEQDLITTLARRPALRWLADERGARWDILTELGRIGEPEAFEAAVEWTLENRPRSEQVKAYLCRFGSGGIILPASASRTGRRPFTAVGVASGPLSGRETAKEESRPC